MLARPKSLSERTPQALVLIMLWAISPLLMAADALEWLHRMNDAVRETTYRGVAVYRSGEQLETLKVYHRYDGAVESERMFSLSGQPREVLRKADEVTCILPDQQTVLVDHQGLRGLLPKLPRAAFEQLRSHYELVALDQTSRVAGRECQGIRIQSRDDYRYSYELWVDVDTALPLDIRLLGEDGELLEQVIFTELEYMESLPDSVFAAQTDTRGFDRVAQPPPADLSDGNLDWELTESPAGFRLANRSRQRMPGIAQPVMHWLYTDGLASVSVFAAQNHLPEQALQGLTRLGGVNAYGRMLNEFHVTVVGEVPQATVRFFGDKLQLRAAP